MQLMAKGKLMAYLNKSVHHCGCYSNSALHMAAWQNRPDVVELLLLNGASVMNNE